MLHYVKCLNKKLDELEQKVVNASQKVIECDEYYKCNEYVNNFSSCNGTIILNKVSKFKWIEFTDLSEPINSNKTIRIVLIDNKEIILKHYSFVNKEIHVDEHGVPSIYGYIYDVEDYNKGIIIVFVQYDYLIILYTNNALLIDLLTTSVNGAYISASFFNEDIDATPIKEIMIY